MKFKTRPMDKKRDPWQFGVNVYDRRLDEHAREYIPRHLRPHPKKLKQVYKWAKTYYPKVDGIEEPPYDPKGWKKFVKTR